MPTWTSLFQRKNFLKKKKKNLQKKSLLNGKQCTSSLLRQAVGLFRVNTVCHIYPMYSDIQSWAKSVDPDQMLYFAASDLGLHCLPFNHTCLDASPDIQMDLFKF